MRCPDFRGCNVHKEGVWDNQKRAVSIYVMYMYMYIHCIYNVHVHVGTCSVYYNTERFSTKELLTIHKHCTVCVCMRVKQKVNDLCLA